MNKLVGFSLLGAALLAVPVWAESECKDDGSTVVNLSAEARRMVTQDRVQATLNIEKTGKTAIDVQKFINEKMQDAKDVYSKVSGVKVSTGGYSVYKQYPPEPGPKPLSAEQREKGVYWQANQQLMIDGASKEAVLKVVGSLQGQGFAVQGLNYYLSREASDALRDDLLMEALGTIRQRAEKMAKSLGMKNVRYARIDMNGGVPPHYPMPMMAMAKGAAMDGAEMAQPVVQAGENEVVMSVSSEVRLSK